MIDTLQTEFLEACGGKADLRLIVEHSGRVSEYVFQKPYVLIGRNPRADLCVDAEQLAPRHAYIQVIAGRVLFVNFMYHLESQQTGWLDPGQPVNIGPLRVRLHSDTLLPDWCRAETKGTIPPPTIRSVLFDVVAREIRSTWRMKRPIALIGNSSACKVRLHDRAVSRFHCALVNTPSGVWSVDLLSTRGMIVNLQRVGLAKLDDGATLSVGGFTLSVRDSEMALEIASIDTLSVPTRHRSMLPAATGSGIVPTAASSTSADNGGALELAESPLFLHLAQIQQSLMVQLQQQMADQFQQAMGIFVEVFWTMHREQANVVRRELRRLRALTRELAELQAQLTRTLSIQSKTVTTSDLALEAANTLTTSVCPAAIAPPVDSKPARVPELPLVASRIDPAPPAPRRLSTPVVTPSAPSPPDAAPPSAPIPPPTAPSPPTPQKSVTAVAQSPAEMHAWLNKRVAEIQRQRNSSWQRLLDVLQGKSAGGKPQSTT